MNNQLDNKEHPIIFCSTMIQRIIAEQKTQTRRIAKTESSRRYGQIGDRLWVKETWYFNPSLECFIYRADNFSENNKIKWKSPIFMSRKASRILLEITDIRAERLQDISEADAIAEGMCSISPKASFQDSWGHIHGRKNPWQSNPFVWVITFKKMAGS